MYFVYQESKRRAENIKERLMKLLNVPQVNFNVFVYKNFAYIVGKLIYRCKA